MRIPLIAAALLAAASPAAVAAQESVSLSLPDSAPSDIFAGSRSREALAAQILLDRAHFSPGVIDGVMGGNTSQAIRAYQRANGLEEDGNLDEDLLRRLGEEHSGDLFRTYRISEDDLDRSFTDVPSGMEEMAELEEVGYETPEEMLAERFHMDVDFLKALNPDADFGSAGTEVVVVEAGENRIGRAVARIEVDKGQDSVRAYAQDGTLLARYPATVGSRAFPSPSGAMEVKAVAPEATYHFDPEGRDWGPDERLTIAAGPNNPVGGIWIDLSKDGYGIHGSPEPQLIGKTASHGCVRLTNWDARELAEAVSPGTTVEFVG